MRRFMIVGMLLFTLYASISCSNPSEDAVGSIAVENLQTVDAKKLLGLVNEVRSSGTTCNGKNYPPVPALSWNSKIEEAAIAHSSDMYKNDFFSHTSSNGDELGDRLNTVSYSYSYAGENIALGYSSEEDVITAWLNSEGHCANIMNKNFTEMAVGRVGDYWTQDFGKPSGK